MYNTNYSPFRKFLAYASIAALILLPIGCSSTQTAAFNADVAAFNSALNSPQAKAIISDVTPIVQTYASGGKITLAQGLNTGLNSIATFDPNLPVDLTALNTQIVKTVTAWTGSGTTASKIANVVLTNLPANANGTQVNASLAAAGIGASNASNPPAATPAP